MFSLHRFCIGAALGLSLLACGPAHAKTYLPLKNPLFTHVSIGAKTAHNPSGVTGWNVFAKGANLAYGSASWTPGASGAIVQALNGALTKNVTFTLTGKDSLTKSSFAQSIYASLRWFTPKGSRSSLSFNIAGSFSAKFPLKTGDRLANLVVYGKKAHLFSLNPGAAGAPAPAAPEVDPGAGAPALALTLGGLALMEDRRRRKRSAQEDATATA